LCINNYHNNQFNQHVSPFEVESATTSFMVHCGVVFDIGFSMLPSVWLTRGSLSSESRIFTRPNLETEANRGFRNQEQRLSERKKGISYFIIRLSRGWSRHGARGGERGACGAGGRVDFVLRGEIEFLAGTHTSGLPGP
jgi:hypothetical protein